MFRDYHFKFIESSKSVLMGIGVFILICIISLFTLGLNSGIDFTGGRNYIVRFDQPVKVGEVEEAVSPHLGEFCQSDYHRLQQPGAYHHQLHDRRGGTRRGRGAARYLAEGLKDFMTPGKTIDDHIQSSTKVGPSIAEDMIRGAFLALFFALIGMGIYILSRFSGWDSHWVQWRVGGRRLRRYRPLLAPVENHALLDGDGPDVRGSDTHRGWLLD